MKTMLHAALLSLLIMQPLTAADMPHYTVTLDVYVQDQQALCQQAWAVALERFGPGVAELVTMTGGIMEPTKCLAVLFQVAAAKQVVSAGIDVRELKK